jgi:hypothetical protein
VTPAIVNPEKALKAADKAAVRLNAAAVLREDALLRCVCVCVCVCV